MRASYILLVGTVGGSICRWPSLRGELSPIFKLAPAVRREAYGESPGDIGVSSSKGESYRQFLNLGF